jgi:hypothetical protein
LHRLPDRLADDGLLAVTGRAPSATTTIVNRAPLRSRWRIVSASGSIRYGISGIRMQWAPPAMPAWSAIQPASRPITSTTMTRPCDVAVVNSRSMHSVAKSTAVSKPKVAVVLSRSLSMVFGTPITRSPARCRWSPIVSDPSPPTVIRASISASRKRWISSGDRSTST